MFFALVLVLLAVLVILNVFLLMRVQSQAGLETRLRDDLTRLQQLQSGDSRALRLEIESRMELIRGILDTRLETMRQTVDEKLQSTLESRLGESFRLVSERLEQVHKGLGEMQTLAAGVGDLKRVLTNVTTRGAWGEVQLENLLAQILAPEQYDRDVSTTGTAERVEFAIKLPGKDADPVWLPVDAKFPMETYQRLAAAAERGDADAVEASARELEAVVRVCAKTFSTKYLAPPRTTDFGILFLATEGLYAEALRRPGLAEALQRDFRVVIAGPTTFAALLNSLQMGFRTLAIQQRSSEVWKLLGDVKLAVRQVFAGTLHHPQTSRTGHADCRRSRHAHARHRTPPQRRVIIRRGGGLSTTPPADRRQRRRLKMRVLILLACAFALNAADTIAWGPPDHGLRFGIAFGPASPEPQIRLLFQNIDRPQCLLPLGSESAKGPVYDVQFTLRAPDGKEMPLFNFNGPPGVQHAVKPIEIDIPRGKTHEIVLLMKKLIYLDNDGKNHPLPEMLARHYSFHASVDTSGEARYTRTRDQWMGKVVSGELRR